MDPGSRTQPPQGVARRSHPQIVALCIPLGCKQQPAKNTKVRSGMSAYPQTRPRVTVPNQAVRPASESAILYWANEAHLEGISIESFRQRLLASEQLPVAINACVDSAPGSSGLSQPPRQPPSAKKHTD